MGRVGGWTSQILRPLVLGPDSLPEIVDASTAERQPLLAALAAAVHSESEKVGATLGAVTHAMRSLDKETAVYLCELLDVGLRARPRRPGKPT
jgi:hypothetical protein